MTESEYVLMQDLEKVRSAILILRETGSGGSKDADDMIAFAYSKLIAAEMLIKELVTTD